MWLSTVQTENESGCCSYSVVFAAPNGAQLQKVADLLASGKAKAHVDRVFPLSEAAKATEYFESRKGGRGKVVLKIQT